MRVLRRKTSSRSQRPEKAENQEQLSPQTIAWNDYLIPGTDTLRNNFTSPHEPYGVVDSDLLGDLEERYVMDRMTELLSNPVQGSFDYDHMRAIHGYLFQDVYPWAGEQRTVYMHKHHGREFDEVADIETVWGYLAEDLAEQDHLKGISDRHEFVDKFAAHWGRANKAHAFREGNTRSQSIFYDQLADEAGWELDLARLSDRHPESLRRAFVDARQYFLDDAHNHAPLAKVLGRLVTRKEQGRQLSAPSIDERRGVLRKKYPGIFTDEASSPTLNDPQLG